jgi:uncharacterized membrane protein
MKDKKILSLVVAALFAALTCVATMVFTIPLPGKGYLNTGDCFVILSGCLLGPVYGGAAAGIGSAFADLILGYSLYAPGTFVIKALMAVAAFFVFKVIKLAVKHSDVLAAVIAGVVAEIIMVLGYFVYEWPMFGFKTAAAAIAGNCLQGVGGVVLSTVVLSVIIRNKYIKSFFATGRIGENS